MFKPKRLKRRLSSGTCSTWRPLRVCPDHPAGLVDPGYRLCLVDQVDPVGLVDLHRPVQVELDCRWGLWVQVCQRDQAGLWVLVGSCLIGHLCQVVPSLRVCHLVQGDRVAQLGLVGPIFLVGQAELEELAGLSVQLGLVDQEVRVGLVVVVDKLDSSEELDPAVSFHRDRFHLVCLHHQVYHPYQARQERPWGLVGTWVVVVSSCIQAPASSAS